MCGKDKKEGSMESREGRIKGGERERSVEGKTDMD
jgi:hypothetical protein